VRIEVEAALQRGVPIIPLLVGDAAMPGPDALPESIRGLSRRNAFAVDFGRDFHKHMEELGRTITLLPRRETIARRRPTAPREIDADGVLRYVLERDATPMSWSEVVSAWQGDSSFQTFFCLLLANCGLASFVWETPAVSVETQHRPFEFVLLEA